jgi:hypothetical protein
MTWEKSKKELAAVIALAVAVCGCGSSGKSPESSTPPASVRQADQIESSTPAAWVRQVDRTCGKATDRLKQIPPVHLTTYGEVVPRIARNERKLAKQLRVLEVPAAERPSVERLAGLLAEQAEKVDGVAVTFGANSDAYERHMRRIRGLDDEIETAARSIGAKACADAPVRTQYL